MLHKTPLSNPKHTLANKRFLYRNRTSNDKCWRMRTLHKESFCSLQTTEQASYRTNFFLQQSMSYVKYFPVDHRIGICLGRLGARTTIISSPEDVWKKESCAIHINGSPYKRAMHPMRPTHIRTDTTEQLFISIHSYPQVSFHSCLVDQL